MRIGTGYDIHRLAPGRKLVLGGVEIPFESGLEGHSDADVICHALCDALLGAAGEGDIGGHFPDTDPAYRGISSLLLLERVGELLAAKNFQVCNADVTVLAERPRLAEFIPQMRDNVARTLKVSAGQINIKAGTHEGLGALGRGQGIACQAVALIRPAS